MGYAGQYQHLGTGALLSLWIRCFIYFLSNLDDDCGTSTVVVLSFYYNCMVELSLLISTKYNQVNSVRPYWINDQKNKCITFLLGIFCNLRQMWTRRDGLIGTNWWPECCIDDVLIYDEKSVSKRRISGDEKDSNITSLKIRKLGDCIKKEDRTLPDDYCQYQGSSPTNASHDTLLLRILSHVKVNII
jgi:hypothetical protein